MSRLQWRKGVDDDIYQIAAHLAGESEELALRFVDAVEKSLKDLARRPFIGSPKLFQSPSLAAVRSWWVEGFPNHLIYYLPLPDGIDVLAVMHGASDVETHLEERA
jgi:plasmid stabilization system protein ParE